MPLEPCDEIWQYILIMRDDINASLASLAQIGWYHQDKEERPTMDELAKWLDEVAKELRERVEKLSGWEH